MPVTSAGKSTGKRSNDAFRPIASSLHLPSAHVALIDDSHERCAALGLSRFESPDLSPISMSELAVLRERNQRLYAHAAPVMEMLVEQIETTQSMVVLCDATGTVIHAIGDDDFLARADKVALAPGANWSESSKGTNGIGTALIAEQPTLVHADEHFVHANHFLTCSASPIFDPRGNMLGVLDVSGDQRSYHQHTMALVRMSARMIENHWLSDDYRHVMRLHFHGRVDFIGTLKEGILAVTAEGRIAGANHSALELLGQSGAALRMQSLPAVLGVTVGQLVDHFRSPLATPIIASTTSGKAFHLLARFDWPVWHTIAEAADASAARSQATTAAAVAKAKVTADADADAKVQSPVESVPAGAASSVITPTSLASPVPAASTVVKDDPWAAWRTGDAALLAVVDKLRRVIDRNVAVVLHGEVGTGKETLARAFHQASQRRQGPFVSLRCMSTTEGGLLSELFGDGRSPGKLAQAIGGTLFISDVAHLPAAAQARLLRALQDGAQVPDGARHAAATSVQLITATRLEPRELRERMSGDHAASALYFRLNGLSLKLPPLRERSDVLGLARRILEREARHAGRQAQTLSPQVVSLLLGSAWPGNVRQVENVLRAGGLMAAGAMIEREHLPEDFVEACARPTTQPSNEASVRSLDALEIEAIEAAVLACGGNISEASKRLGVSRNTIYRRLRWKDKRA